MGRLPFARFQSQGAEEAETLRVPGPGHEMHRNPCQPGARPIPLHLAAARNFAGEPLLGSRAKMLASQVALGKIEGSPSCSCAKFGVAPHVLLKPTVPTVAVSYSQAPETPNEQRHGGQFAPGRRGQIFHRHLHEENHQ